MLFYRDSPFSCWLSTFPSARSSSTEPSLSHLGCSSTEPSLFHVGCSSTKPTFFHVGCRPHPLQALPLQSQPFFMLDVVLKSQPFFMLDVGLNTYIWPWEEPILPPCQKGTTLTSNHGRNQSYHHARKADGNITSPSKEPWFGEHQDSPWSTQNSI